MIKIFFKKMGFGVTCPKIIWPLLAAPSQCQERIVRSYVRRDVNSLIEVEIALFIHVKVRLKLSEHEQIHTLIQLNFDLNLIIYLHFI